ncbi:MAG: hypothetical protein JWQ96_1603 [Segetibacter sp.]|nr:hypothetical protein [Segetibacter sp.]
MTNPTNYLFKTFLLGLVITITSILNPALAQSQNIQVVNQKSKVTVVPGKNQIGIYITGFPANTSVVVFDDEDNLISVVSTNKFGDAFIAADATIKNIIYAKTLNGEIIVTNKPYLLDNTDGTPADPKFSERA